MNTWRPFPVRIRSIYQATSLLASKLTVVFAWLLVLSTAPSCTRHLGKPPVASAPGASSYAQRLRHLEQADSLRNFSSALRLSAAEEQANRRLVALRQRALAHYDSIHFFPPARNFYRGRHQLYASPLYRLLKTMPKGGVHHLHPGAGGSPWWMVRRAVREPNCYVFWQPDRGPYLKGQLHFFRAGEVPAGFVAAQVLQRTVPGFEAQLHELLTFDERMSRDSVDVWREFEKRFQRVGGFTGYQPVFEDMAVATFDSLVADGVQHVELRTGLSGSLYDLRHPAGSFPADSIIHYYQRAARRVRARQPAFTFKLIYADLRFKSTEQIQRSIRTAFRLHRRYPGVVAAFDLVAHEDAGHPTRYFQEVWRVRDSLAAATGVQLPLCLHDGESTWQHVPNVYDAAVLGSNRIGHGFNLGFFPAAEDLVREQHICIEVSPLSNQLLDYVGDLRLHPAHTWIRRGVQISISPDDPAIFDYVGVTPDYWSIFLAWELDLRDLKQLALNGINYSYLDAAEKQRALAAWQQDWQRFVARLNQGT
jgi:adenosine deaminase CECR1